MLVEWSLSLLALALLGAGLLVWRNARAETRDALREIRAAHARGSHRARLQYPAVDLSQCIGCGACIRACPEEGVLALVHGQALVAHGARCVGHGLCAEACPTSAIAVQLDKIEERRDLPALRAQLESVTAPGVYLAGELTGYALIKTAIRHGRDVAADIARRVSKLREAERSCWPHDLVIVGAGPAGLACAIRARELGLRACVLERDRIGGTIAHYPRRKLVMTSPVDIASKERLDRSSYSKEELVELWQRLVAEHELDVREGFEFEGLERDGLGYAVRASGRAFGARFVVLALGRRGTPRKLGVRGEERSNVAYSLVDADAYEGRKILVVGGGDSAVEAALGLAARGRNDVTLSYRKAAFTRLKARNEAKVAQAIVAGQLGVRFESELREVADGRVVLRERVGDDARELELPNDDVFILAGGVPPFGLLEASGVSCDPADRGPEDARGRSSYQLLWAILSAAALLAFCAMWSHHHADYYQREPAERALHELHESLAPGRGIGLVFGVVASLCILLNLAYLWRRSRWGARLPFSLRAWMTSHVVTGFAALGSVALHAGMAPRDTNGGHAFVALAIVVVAGTLGRFLYAFVPRAANGRELAIEEVRAQVSAAMGQLDRSARGSREAIEAALLEGAVENRWQRGALARFARLFGAGRRWRAVRDRIDAELVAGELAEGQRSEILELSRRIFRDAWRAAHLEDLRALLASWRWVHRWLALLMLLVAIVHIVAAVRFGGLWA